MDEKFVIKNKSGTLLSIPIERNHLRMNPNDQVDLCAITGMSADDLERHPQIVRNLTYNNIVVIEKYSNKNTDMGKINSKMDQIVDLLLSKNDQVKRSDIESILSDAIGKLSFPGSSVPESIVSDKVSEREEERIREDLLRKQLDAFKPDRENKGSFGQNKMDIDTEDFSQLLKDKD